MTTASTTTAVVTGAGRGIGQAIAGRLAAAGHRVLVTDINADSAQRTADEIGCGAWAVRHDVRDPGAHREIAAAALREGRLAVWVNNAGILLTGDAWTHTDDELTSMLEVNVRGTIAGCHAAIEAMHTTGGSVLNIASLSALAPVPGLALYAATKAAVLSYTTSLQGDLDHAGLPIRVRALCPDVVGTEMVSAQATAPGAALLFAGPRPLTPDAVAKAGLELLESRQIFRVLPRWRGLVARSSDIAPAAGIRALAVLRRRGERQQYKDARTRDTT